MSYVAYEEFPARRGAAAQIPETNKPLPAGWFDRLGMTLGAGAIGLALGFAATMAFGRVDPMATAVASGPLYLIALHLAGRTIADAIARRAWFTLGLACLLCLALAAWPLALFIAPPSSPDFWFGAPLTLSALLALIVVSPMSPGAVARAGLLSLLVAALGAHQATLFIMGA
ncbi:MAG TPA: hypothetical protein VG943_04980 [Caulobacterales bacterium]|nr:hypothetical protein [Caulobacterales bacterium]